MTAHPTTALLAVEVADSSLAQDRLTKTRLYAAAGIPEVWIINLRDNCVEVYRDPAPTTRTYHDTVNYRAGAHLTIQAFPDTPLAVSELLPPLAE